MPKSNPKSRRQQLLNKKSLDKGTKKQLAKLNAVGLFKPTGRESPATLKRKVSKITKSHSQELNPDRTFFVKVPKGKNTQTVLAKAKELGLQTTSKGFFFEKKPGFKGTASKDQEAILTVTKTGKARLVIKSSGRSQQTGRVKTQLHVIPLDTPDQLIQQENRLRREADRLMPLKKGESLSFIVTEKDRSGFSRDSFKTADDVIRHISHYEKRRDLNTPTKKKLWKNYFFRHVSIIKTTRAEIREKSREVEERHAIREKQERQRIKRQRKKVRVTEHAERLRRDRRAMGVMRRTKSRSSMG